VARNPFKPTAGATPPLLVGREDVLRDFEESLEDGPGAPDRLVRFTGARGVGKTVMLTEVADVARRHGWATIAETATPGLVERLTSAVILELYRVDPDAAPGRQISGVSLPQVMGTGGGGLSWTTPAEQAVGFREQVGRLLDVLESRDAGLLITIDEVHAVGRHEMRDTAAVFQHLVGEDRDVALAFAGLPSAVSDLLNDKVLTFLRRATPVQLEDVPLDEVRSALARSITESGRYIDAQALDAATVATGGYPFMIQLVGYHVWRKANGLAIDLVSAKEGIAAARNRLGSTVHATALADLSDIDRTYLLAMAQDDGPSNTGTVASRMGKTPQYANVYRTRLIEAGVIEPVMHGYVDFSIPYLREYLREHAARYELERGGQTS
jgi:hypothetical protein